MIEIGAKKPEPNKIPLLPAKLELTEKEIIIKFEDKTYTVPIENGEFNLLELDDVVNGILSKIYNKEAEKMALRRRLMGH